MAEPPLEELTALPRPLAGFYGSYFKGEGEGEWARQSEGEGRPWKGKRGEVRGRGRPSGFVPSEKIS